jgi:hypothetical protein
MRQQKLTTVMLSEGAAASHPSVESAKFSRIISSLAPAL